MNGDELHIRFNFHLATEVTGPKHGAIREAALKFARLVSDLTPESREQSLAITAIEEAMMWANAAIARRTA